ncbi:hypothetical protein A9J41_04320 [Laribacter hongkongensis]|nr:hypothetical protein [Laribacter hongkongensis]
MTTGALPAARLHGQGQAFQAVPDAGKPFSGIRACQTETGPTPANHGSRMLTRLPHLLPGIDARPDAAADRAMPPFRHTAAARRPA